MPTAITNGTDSSHTEELDSSDKPAKRGNPLMRALNPDMLKDPYELDFADNMMSNEFAWEKTNKHIFEPLGLNSEKEYVDHAKACWKWKEGAQKREAEAIAQKLLAEAESNPFVKEALKKKLA